MTLGEVFFWKAVNKKPFHGYDFHRQKPIDRYIVDFFCEELMLAIEIDGITHDFKFDEDKERQKRLEAMGVRVLRFTERSIRKKTGVRPSVYSFTCKTIMIMTESKKNNQTVLYPNCKLKV